jgi:hypothetical protein
MIMLGVSMGLTFPTTTNAALHQTTGQDCSLASGVQTTVQQVGGALGLACLVTLALRHAAGQLRHGVLPTSPPPTATRCRSASEPRCWPWAAYSSCCCSNRSPRSRAIRSPSSARSVADGPSRIPVAP